jgi:hypothetical protein
VTSRPAVAALVLGACSHAAPAAPAPLTGEAPPPVEHRYVVTLGPSEIGWSPEVVHAMPARYFRNAVLPPLGPIASCGMGLYVGDSEVAWCMDGTQFVFDENDNTDLHDDPPHTVIAQGADRASVTIAGRFRLEVEHLVTPSRTLDVFMVHAKTSRHGLLDLDGRQLEVHLYADFGRFDRAPKGRKRLDVEGYDVTADHVDIWDHRRLRYAVARDGSRVTFTEVPR